MLRTLHRWTAAVKNWLRAVPREPADAGGRWIEKRHPAPAGPRFLRHGRRPDLAYRLFMPDEQRVPAQLPLLVMLHGCKQDSQSFAEGTRMNALANRECLAVLYPEQSSRANSQRCWNWFDVAALGGRGEARLIVEMILEVVHRHPIDPARIYIAGMSAGGAMAQLLATRFPQLFAGCAVHSGLMYRAATSALQALAAMREGSRVSPAATTQTVGSLAPHAATAHDLVPTIVIHGDRDEVVHTRNAEQTVEQVLSIAQNAAARVAPLIEAGIRSVRHRGRPYLIRDYHRDGRPLVRRITVEGLGHAWSGGDAKHPFNDPQGPDASQLIWEFLSRHRREDQGVGLARLPRAARAALIG